VELSTCRDAIHAALGPRNFRFLEDDKPSGWVPWETYRYPGDPPWAGGTFYRDTRRLYVGATPAEVWEQIETLGGKTGCAGASACEGEIGKGAPSPPARRSTSGAWSR
jgi:hypothetical protein